MVSQPRRNRMAELRQRNNMDSTLYKRIRGSFVATVGFLLSPLSWWNDLYVNIPIAYVFSWLVCLLDKRLFGGAMVFFYWMTNLAGLLLMQKGLADTLSKDAPGVAELRKSVLKDVLLSFVYTAILALLVYTGILKPPTEYFKK